MTHPRRDTCRFSYARVRARAHTHAVAHTPPYNYYVRSVHLQCKRESISEWQFARYIIQSERRLYTIRSRFSRRNNADISTLASPSPVRGWPGAGDGGGFAVSATIFSFDGGTRHTPILFCPPGSPLPRPLFHSRRRGDGRNNSFRECVPASEAVDSSHVWDTWQRVNNVAGGPVRLALYFESRMDGSIVNQSVGRADAILWTCRVSSLSKEVSAFIK